MPTNKQQREAAHRKLQRQLERRETQARKRRQNWIITAAVASVVVVALSVWLIVEKTGEDKTPVAAGSDSAAPIATTPAVAPEGCTYTSSPGGSEVKDVGAPKDVPKANAEGTVTLNVATTQGDMVFTLDRAEAPCAVASWQYLVSKKFFDKSPCHRLTTGGIFVLQCGDPSGTGTGGPAYRFLEETPKAAKPYTKGTIAMANSSSAGSTGSQFFIMWKDSLTLPPNYSVVGKVSKGLDVVEKVAAGGDDGSNSSGDGKPNVPITINSITEVK